MRKLFTFLFAALMSASMFALDPKGEDTWDETTKTLTVNSNPGENAYKYKDEIQHVIINNGVTSIGVDAFYYCSGLTSVTIPNSVTSIGDEAFYYCTGLTSVTCVRETPANLGSGVFDHTHANLKIYVPAGSVAAYKAAWTAYADKIKAIPPAWVRDGDEWDYATKTLTVNSDQPGNAYKDQTEIKHVIISNSVTSIEWGAFFNCTGLTSVTIGNSVTSIGAQAFAICTALKSITIPNSVTSIGTCAFGDCTSLEKVTIYAESLEWYGLSTFQVTPASLKIYVPAGSVDTYKAGWSEYADKITAIVVNPVQIDGLYYNLDTDNQTAEVTSMPSGKYTGDIIIPESVEYYSVTYTVTSIGDEAFSGCTALTSITIPNSVTSIGQSAFASCSGLTSVRCVRETPASLGNDVFYGTAAALKIYVPAGSVATYKAGWSTYADKIQPAWVRDGDEWDEATKTLTVNSNPGYQAYFEQTEIENVIINNSVTSIGESAFAYCSSLSSVTIPNSVTSIGTSAFYQCSSLSSVTIPNSVTSIGGSAFSGCTGLTSVTIGNSVTSIGSAAFKDCTGLTSVTIGNSVTSIGQIAFAYCSSLSSMTIDATTPPSLGENAFRDLTLSAIKLYVPASSASAYKAAAVWQNFYFHANPTAHEDPQNTGTYYSTFYDSDDIYLLPTGVEAYVATLSGSNLLLTKIAKAGEYIPNNCAVILKSTVSSYDLFISKETPVTFSANNDLEGVDVAIAKPANCYVLSCENNLVGFYQYNGTNLNPHKAYVVFSGSNQAPRRMPFIFDQATGVENVQGNVQSTKVLRDGQLIIIRNGVEYNANGMMVK